MSDIKDSIKLFEEKQVRAVWDEDAEKWWFSVLDVVGILTSQPDYIKIRNYWKWLKKKLITEGSQLVSDTTQLKMKSDKFAQDCAIDVNTSLSALIISSFPVLFTVNLRRVFHLAGKSSA